MGSCRVTEFRHKEVVNSTTGRNLGCIDDVVVDTVTAKLVSLIIYGKPRFFGLLGRYDDLVINWSCIELVGKDTILVNHCPEPESGRKRRCRLPLSGMR